MTTRYTGPGLCGLDAHVVVKMLKQKEIKPSELLDAAFERIAQVEPKVNALPTLCEQRARDSLAALENQAKSEDAGPEWLAGLPLGWKFDF